MPHAYTPFQSLLSYSPSIHAKILKTSEFIFTVSLCSGLWNWAAVIYQHCLLPRYHTTYLSVVNCSRHSLVLISFLCSIVYNSPHLITRNSFALFSWYVSFRDSLLPPGCPFLVSEESTFSGLTFHVSGVFCTLLFNLQNLPWYFIYSSHFYCYQYAHRSQTSHSRLDNRNGNKAEYHVCSFNPGNL